MLQHISDLTVIIVNTVQASILYAVNSMYNSAQYFTNSEQRTLSPVTEYLAEVPMIKASKIDLDRNLKGT